MFLGHKPLKLLCLFRGFRWFVKCGLQAANRIGCKLSLVNAAGVVLNHPESLVTRDGRDLMYAAAGIGQRRGGEFTKSVNIKVREPKMLERTIHRKRSFDALV